MSDSTPGILPDSRIRVLYLGMRWDYGDPARGASFEEHSFHSALKAHPNVEVEHFDFMELHRQLGRGRMNERLAETVEAGDYDCLFCVPFTDELDRALITKISARSEITTIAWGCDDHWRFEDYSRYWAPAFNWWVTTARSAVPKFRAMSYESVIKSQWGVEPTEYRPLDVPRDIDVSFVGQPHGVRPQILQRLYEARIQVHVFGYGWAGLQSRITHEQMLEVFSRSKVSLNLSNASVMGEQQIKGRVFEVPACRSFLLTDMADDLGDYYRIGTEIVVYESLEDLIDKARYFIEHDEEREAVARAGYDRALRDHTWRARFDDVFKQAGV